MTAAFVELALPSIDRSAARAAARQPGDEADWARAFGRIAAGDGQGLEELYELAARPVFGLALWRTGSTEDAADVVQEVFVRVAADRARLATVTRPRSWLLALAHHVAIDFARRRRRRSTEPLEAAELLVAPAEDPDRALDARRASRALAGLSPGQRDAVYLRELEGLTFAEIGRITGVPLFTAASRHRLGIRKLRRLLEVEP